MFGWFVPKMNRVGRKVQGSARLSVESLEERYCPTTDYPTPMTMPASVAPTLTCVLTYLDHRMIRVQGSVTDDHPATAVVSFYGAAAGTTTVQSDGSFSIDLNASSLGMVEAIATDADNNNSNEVMMSLTSANPSITMNQALTTGDNIWTFSGHVWDESFEGLTITFGTNIAGVTLASVQVDANGDFETTVFLPANASGYVWATTIDWWGLNSNQGIALVR